MSKYLILIFLAASLVCLYSCDENTTDDDNNNIPIEVNPGAEIEVSMENDYIDMDTVRSIKLSRLPFSFFRFSEVQAEIGHTPEGAAAAFILALRVYQQYDFEGVKCLVSSVFSDNKIASTSSDSYLGWTLFSGDWSLIKSKLGGASRLPYAYMKGATPANGYIPDENPYTIEIIYDKNNSDVSSGQVRLYVVTKGAQSNRPMTLKKDSDNIWRATNFSSIFTGLM